MRHQTVVGELVRSIVLIGNVRVMMATKRRRTRAIRGDHQKGTGKRQDHLNFHYALQRVETASRPSWFDVFCGEARRLIGQCGEKRARTINQMDNPIALARKFDWRQSSGVVERDLLALHAANAAQTRSFRGNERAQAVSAHIRHACDRHQSSAIRDRKKVGRY
ncbi:MAG TPA: hypothetical protein VIY51_15705 [Xanthobacteraceae bacterium]